MYVGRIVAVGKTSKPFVAYRVSSRSFPNRIAKITEIGIAIQPLNPEDMKRNPYIAYNCIRVSKSGVVVSNGSHTDPIWEKLEAGVEPETALREVLADMGYEKDELNTPRIAGIVTDCMGYIGIVRADGVESAHFALKPNLCRVICTYEMNRVEDKDYPFIAETPLDAAKFIVNGGIFANLEKSICSAAWMENLAVFNPFENK